MPRKWLPLAPPNMPGAWGDLSNMIPTRAGTYYAPNIYSFTSATSPSAGGTMCRAWCAMLPDDSIIAYAGTTTKLYSTNSTFGTFTDRSGAAYTGSDWSFAQYGNITIAVNRADAVQTRDATGASNFANATGSPPKARIVVTQAEQVLLFDLNDGAEKPDAYAACAPGDYTDWSGAGATTATRIRHRPGKITAALAFKDYVLVFKQSSVYRLTYTGNNTFKWRTELIATGRGAYGKHDAIACGDVVVFHGPGGAWIYDGGRFQSITDWVGEPAGLSVASSGSVYDSAMQSVSFWNTGALALYYNITADAWGKRSTVDGFSGDYGTYRPLTGEPPALRAIVSTSNPDNVYLVDITKATAVVTGSQGWGQNTANGTDIAYLLGGIEGTNDRGVQNFSELNPRYARTTFVNSSLPSDNELLLDVFTGDSSDSDSLQWQQGYGTPTQASLTSSTTQRRFDINVSTPYARFKLKAPSNSGYFEVADYNVVTQPDGEL